MPLIYSSLHYVYSISAFYFHLIMTFWKRRNVVLCFITFYRRILLSNIQLYTIIPSSEEKARGSCYTFMRETKVSRITRPSSVAKNDCRFFQFWYNFHETTSNYYRYQNPFKREDIMKGKLELETTRHMKNCLNFLRRHEICRVWDVSFSH